MLIRTMKVTLTHNFSRALRRVLPFAKLSDTRSPVGRSVCAKLSKRYTKARHKQTPWIGILCIVSQLVSVGDLKTKNYQNGRKYN